MAHRQATGQTPGVSTDPQSRRENQRILEDERVEFARHGEPVARAVAPLPAIHISPPTPRLALTIRQFCEAFSISEAFYYKLKKQRQGPREMKVGARTLISLEAADAWRREREGAA